MNTKRSHAASSFDILPRLMAAGFVLLCLPQGMADTLTWDPTQVITSPPGGSGNWNTTSAFWSNGTSDVVWNNANNDTASFAGTSATYTVTIQNAVAISAGGLAVTSGNSATLAGVGTGSLTLAGATPTITNVGNLTLGIALQGAGGLTKTGGGILRFNTASTYTGNTLLSQGQTVLAATNALPTTTQLTMAGSAQVTIQANQSISGLTGVSGNNIRNTTGSNWTLSLTGGTNSYAGSVTETSTGFLSLGISGGTTALTGTNSYRGSTTVSGGTLNLGSNLASSGSVIVSGGTLASTVANVNLGLGATSMSSGAVTPGGIGAVGSFTLASGQNFITTGGTLTFDLSSAISFDKIIGAGAGSFSLANTTLALSGLTSTSGTYQIFSGFGGSNTVTNLTITGLSPGYTGSLDAAGLLTVVPEPSTWALLAFSLTGVVVMRRLRIKRL